MACSKCVAAQQAAFDIADAQNQAFRDRKWAGLLPDDPRDCVCGEPGPIGKPCHPGPCDDSHVLEPGKPSYIIRPPWWRSVDPRYIQICEG